jgi:hypothetical protein
MKAILAGACLAALFALPAAADVCSKGQVAVVRVSTLKSPASRPAFDKAVSDQIAWYRSHGITSNKIVTAEVIDLSTGTPMASTKDVMTIHYDPPAAMGKQPAVDDGYKAFVKEFRDSSDITTEKTVCLPK